ncbi:hypothetical protein GEV33_006898 [Tenebrio molitor]|uniref:Uncharacterized protein n=1 Tax=Tenebrio molitor TaxID=7067 RepID=A0A8J6HKD2_TENMO|nr:hypothetical protein GEV33_006898 [Tenebrio molitor]
MVHDRFRVCVFVLKGGGEIRGGFPSATGVGEPVEEDRSGWKIVQEELQPYAAADLGFFHEGQRPYASADHISPPCWAVVIPQDPTGEQDLTPKSRSSFYLARDLHPEPPELISISTQPRCSVLTQARLMPEVNLVWINPMDLGQLGEIRRIRMIFLGKNPGITQSHVNIELQQEEIKEEFLLAKAFKQAKTINFTVTEPLGIEEIPDDSSSTSTSTTSSVSRSGRASVSDGLIYLAGFLAKQNLTKHPYLGTFTHTTKDLTFHAYAMTSWLQSLSFGGLIEPSSEWLSQVKIMEKYFQKYHKKQFQEGKNIIKRTTEYITKKMNKPNIIY